MSCGMGCRHGSDLALLWLWHRLAAVAPIRPLAWEPSYAVGAALKRQKKKKKKKQQQQQQKKPKTKNKTETRHYRYHLSTQQDSVSRNRE